MLGKYEMNHRLVNFVRTLVKPPRASVLSTSRSLCSSSSPTNNKLFIAGLSWSVDERSLTDAFSPYGEISGVRIVYDKETGRSKGFGFVYFSKEDEARCAKDAMNGKVYQGQTLRISYGLEKVRGAPLVVPRFKKCHWPE